MNEMKQKFYRYVTTPIAKVLDFVNIPKRMEIQKRQRKIAFDNKCQYIGITSKALIEQDLQEHASRGELPHPLLLPLLIAHHIDTAYKMFDEKKKNGDFDELNIMLR